MDGSIVFPVVAAAALAALVLPALGRRRAARLQAEEDGRRRLAAGAAGLILERGGAAPGASPAAAAASARSLVLSGTSSGLAWSAEVETDPPSEHHARRTIQHRTRITFPAIRAGAGTFVLVMALPPGAPAPPDTAEGEGLLASLKLRAVEALLDLYVTGTFGARHRALVNAKGAARPTAPAGLFALSTDASLAAHLLDPEGAARLQALRDVGGGAAGHEIPAGALSGFGLLATPEGLVYAVQASLHDPALLREVAARVARVAERLRW